MHIEYTAVPSASLNRTVDSSCDLQRRFVVEKAAEGIARERLRSYVKSVVGCGVYRGTVRANQRDRAILPDMHIIRTRSPMRMVQAE